MFFAIVLLLLGGLITGLSEASHRRAFVIPSASMSPALVPGDRIVVDTRAGARPRRGEIWVFRMPNGGNGVKRVIALPGDTVEFAGGRVILNGVSRDEHYAMGSVGADMPAQRLAAGEYLMLGDSRAASQDSRVWGPVPGEMLVGRADYLVWPTSRAGKITAPIGQPELDRSPIVDRP